VLRRALHLNKASKVLNNKEINTKEKKMKMAAGAAPVAAPHQSVKR
jgi:hypothetical protein